MFDPELLRRYFEQAGAQGGMPQVQQSPQMGGAQVAPAQITPANITPAGPQPQGQPEDAGGSGGMFGGLFDRLRSQMAAQQQPVAPVGGTPGINPSAPVMPQQPASPFPRDLSTGAVDESQYRSQAPIGTIEQEGRPTLRRNVAPPQWHAPMVPPEEPRPIQPKLPETVSTSTNAGDIPGQAQKRNVAPIMVPSFAGERREWKPDDGINSRQYEYVTEKMGPDGKVKRSGMDILKSAGRGFLLGAASNGLAGGLGGAAAGAIQGAVDPTGARKRNFDTFHRPALIAEEQRRYQQQQQQGVLQKQQVDIQHVQNQDQVAIVNANRQAAVAQSTIRRNIAQTEAARTGTPQRVDLYNEETERIETALVFKDKTIQWLGASGTAMTADANRKATMDRDAANRKSRESEGALNRGVRVSEGEANRSVRQSEGEANRSVRSAAIPPEAKQEFTRVSGLERQAKALRQRAELEQDATKGAALDELALAAEQEAQSEMAAFGEAFGDYYLVEQDPSMPGEFLRIRQKATTTPPRRSGGQSGSKGPTAKLSDLTKYLK